MQKINAYSGVFWGVVLAIVIIALYPPDPVFEEWECEQVVKVHRTATVTFDYCLDNDTVRYRDEWRDASMIEKRLLRQQEMQVERLR